MTTRSRVLRGLGAAILGAVIAVTAAACSSGGGTQTLDVKAFGDRVATEGVVTLDVRTPEEFASGHLPGAMNIDVEAADFVDRLADLDKDATYAVYCRSGNRSKVAMDLMAKEGFTDLADLDGGITAWSAAGGAVVS